MFLLSKREKFSSFVNTNMPAVQREKDKMKMIMMMMMMMMMIMMMMTKIMMIMKSSENGL